MAKKICGIYCIENIVNHKRYIGLSRDIYARLKQHKSKLIKNKHINMHLQEAWNKYGENCFIFFILEECPKERIKEREIYYIDLYNANNNKYGYNMTSGGDGVRDLDQYSKDKLSNSRSRKKVVQLTLDGKFIKEYRNCSIAAKSIHASQEENIRSCCDHRFGYKSAYGFIWCYKDEYGSFNICNYEKDNCYKGVVQYDFYGNKINEFTNARIAEQQTGVSYKLISSVCHGYKRQSHGYIWRFADDPFDKFDINLKSVRKINKFDKSGVLLQTYNSVKEAINSYGSSIQFALSGKYKTAYGFIWKYAS